MSAFDTPWLPQVQLIAQGKLTATPEQALEMAIALIGREAERGLYIESNREWRDETHRLESELADARARIAELDHDLATERNANEYQRARRLELEREIEALQSRNAAEKAAADFMREHGETLWTYLHDYDDPPKMPPALERAIAALGRALEVLTPAPDAKGAPK